MGEEIRLTTEGLFLVDGEEITHERTLALFYRSVIKEGDQYFLQVGDERKPIIVEDTTVFVKHADPHALKIWLSDGREEALDPATISYTQGRLTCKTGQGLEARFTRSAYYDFLRQLEQDDGGFFIDIKGKRVDLAQAT